MLQKMQDYMDRNILDEAKKREEFLNAQNQEQSPIEQQPGFFNPDPMKLSKLSYGDCLTSGWQLISRASELGHNLAGYQWKPVGAVADGEYRVFEDHIPSYLHLKKINVDDTPNHILAYVFHDNRSGGKEPIIYPQEMFLKY